MLTLNERLDHLLALVGHLAAVASCAGDRAREAALTARFNAILDRLECA